MGQDSFVYGLLTGSLTTIITCPLHNIVFHQQLHNTLVREAVVQLWGEGWHKFYRGIAPPLLIRTIQCTLLFGVQDYLHRCLSTEHFPRPLLQATAGVGTGVVEAVVITPLERVQNVLQNSKNDRRLLNHSVLERLKSVSLALGFYRALLPIIARNAVGNGLYFGLKNPVRDAFDFLPPVASSFTSAMVNSLVISLPLYPLSVLVANMQAGVGQEDAGSGLKESARKLWVARQRSVALLYRGSSLVILRSCVSWSITTAIYDWLQRQEKHT